MDTKATRATLSGMRADLDRRLAAIDADLRVLLEPDSQERATQVENDEVLRRMQAEAAEQIAAIDAALERLDNGAYGRCAKCHEEIGKDRLAAVPYTAFCISCARSLA
ncbi:TraR/DksA C4-type zinc finger protein [Rhizobium sp. BK376]|uniref:TraR/DksA family transcriptional regulator n=1 Tax=Rhizobium sp. BK376 TaxID=2512149 RepID=UPI001049A374|nr:TraR/DksA C4-type zinc finger protein [Rhizobium sp. BK376]TCR76655.1 TraR/DksA family transcriptional regulator [Rhizobium sp. BK376]